MRLYDIVTDIYKRNGFSELPVMYRTWGPKPEKEDMLFGYCTVLRSMTGGRGEYEYEFVRYEQCPSDVQEKEVAARASKLVDLTAED